MVVIVALGAGVDPNVNEDACAVGAGAGVAPKEKVDGVLVAAEDAGVAPNPNVPVLPPNGALVDGFVAVVAPNVNGLAEVAPEGAVVVELLPNANGVAFVVVGGFVDDPNENIFLLKYST